ncbi:MAG: PAS domain S-box protein, partial [Clostridia bacterium]|nr:PAS domain S-box protein [Clostridia bacterium]
MGKMPIQDELEKLKLNDKILEAIIDASFDELFVTNGDGKTLRVSKGAYLRLYGVNPQDLVGKNVQEMETEGSFNPSVFPRILQEKRAITFVQQTSEGREMLVTSTPVFGEDGEIEMVVSNSRDITELIDLQVRIEKAESLNKQYEEEIISLRNVLLNLNGHIIVASPQMKGIMQMVSKISQTDTTVLILGPSG